MATAPVMNIIPPYTPELLSDVVLVIEERIRSINQCKVLELGAGWSTLWFAELECDILSIEHDVDWFLQVNAILFKENLNAHLLRLNSCLIQDIIIGLNPEYDIILVDCIDEERIPCLKIARYKLRKNGWIMVDDTHWEEMSPVSEIMQGWNSLVIRGMHTRKDGNVKEHETTIFFR